jgi:yeast amino acid transporter
MSESPQLEDQPEKEVKAYTVPDSSSDPELGDHGILVQSNPLSRELKGRHMQMIAIGTCLDLYPHELE